MCLPYILRMLCALHTVDIALPCNLGKNGVLNCDSAVVQQLLAVDAALLYNCCTLIVHFAPGSGHQHILDMPAPPMRWMKQLHLGSDLLRMFCTKVDQLHLDTLLAVRCSAGMLLA